MTSSTRSTSGTPLVSACVPTYNGADFLEACLDSLLDQDLKDIEVLVGDDGSQDETLEIARRRGDPRLRVLPFTTRAGMVPNWNRCIAEARGKYVSLVAQDDVVAPAWGERLVELLESHPEADLAFCHREFGITDEHTRNVLGDFFEDKYLKMLNRFYDRIGTVVPPETMLEAAMEHEFEINLTGEPSFNMLRRDHPAVRAGYSVKMRQLIDWEFATRFFVDRPILHCPESLGTYRIHAAGASANKAVLSKQCLESIHLLDNVLSRFHGRLSAEQASRLHGRLAEMERLREEWLRREAEGLA